MPIQQAMQLANLLEQDRAGRFDGRRGSDQILGLHLGSILSREQRLALGFQNPAECRPGLSANPLQLVFRGAAFFRRHRSTLLG